MPLSVLFAALFLVLLLAPLILKLLQQILPLLRARLSVALRSTAGWLRSAFRGAGLLMTEDGALAPFHVVAQVAGALLMTAAGVVFAVCDLEFTLATLSPLLGLTYNGSLLATFDQLLGLSTVLLAVIFGLVLTNLLGWTFVTRFAVTERGRLGAFCLALLGFVGALAVAVPLALYRIGALTVAEINSLGGEPAAWVQTLPPLILLPLAVLLLFGAVFALMSLETLASVTTALLLAGRGSRAWRGVAPVGSY